ncbi:hypothetical protein EDB85DRAFT_2158312 [Lactarius pseudohatsudake]|nr:hypothetical protein EDB85DRAFT_2158312 [Lactarius pseudohatsudake]
MNTPKVQTQPAGDYEYRPKFVPNRGEPNFVDASEHIFSMYWESASEADKKLAEGWKADADRILIFAGLFSSTITTLIAVSIQDIRPNSQVDSNFYLSNIYQLLADPSRANISLPSSPPPFSPPNYAIWVNSFWILSLIPQDRSATLPSTQASANPRIFCGGGPKVSSSVAFDALSMLLHISLFLFFAGLTSTSAYIMVPVLPPRIFPPPLAIRTRLCVNPPTSPTSSDNVAFHPTPLASSPDLASLSTPAPLREDENLTDVPLPNNSDIFVPDLSHAVHQKATAFPQLHQIPLPLERHHKALTPPLARCPTPPLPSSTA